MTPAAQTARDAAVAALVAAGGWDLTIEDIEPMRPLDIIDAIDTIGAYLFDDAHHSGGARSPADLAALHALALLLAELTAPAPATCATGCVRLAAEGPGHPGACSVPETGGGR